ncbi:MAG: MFS transporter [Candidatus Riflebacteria bacterium]|nr:MFS transporter [Candidatus Riflebacteria bacterium]
MLFRSLKHRNYRLFFLGQGISLIGTWMQMTAVTWLVWRLSHSAFLLGLTGFASRIPTFVLAPFAGVLVDRLDRYRLVIWAQVFSMIQALMLAALMYSGRIQIWHVIVLSLVLGFINALDLPARQSLLVQMIDKPEDLSNAIALNSTMVNGARLIGPSIAGILTAVVGEALCFLINGLTYTAVIAGLLMMRVKPNARIEKKTNAFDNLKEGFSYAFGFLPIRHLLFLLALVSFTGVSYTQLLPIFSQQVFHGDASTQGFLFSSAAIGALVGALYLAGRKDVPGLERVIAWSPMILGGGLIGLGFSSRLWLSLAIMPFIGLGQIVQMASTNTVLQTIVDDDKRGRIMSFYSMAFMGMVPLGSLFAGILAEYIGAPLTVILGGVCCIAGSFSFARQIPRFRELVHPIYVRKGILLEIHNR